MSASTVSITANQGPATRRRPVEKNTLADGSDAVTAPEHRDLRPTAVDTANAILRDARKALGKKSVPVRKSPKPRWLTAVSILTKNLALIVILIGFIQMIRWLVLTSGRDSGDFSVISGDFEGKIAEVEKFVKKTMKAMQVQVGAIDQKLEDGISSVRKELEENLGKRMDETDLKLKALDARFDVFEKFVDEFGSNSFLSKEEFSEFFEEFKKDITVSSRGEVSMDEIKDYARGIVEKEIEKHAADGLGMVDYALATGGGKVVRHSEPYGVRKVGGFLIRSVVSAEVEKMIRPSFGEPGQCFPLKGGSGFVEIRLRTAIVPEAVTLEHVSESVAYDRSSAPKDCRVSGWLQGPDSSGLETSSKKMFLLTEFTYDLKRTSAQTFKVNPAATNLIDIVRLDFTSNHGSPSHTCIYRLRVHGYEPTFVLEKKS